MSFGNLAKERDLQPLFGTLTPERNERLLERLLAVDARLRPGAVKEIGQHFDTNVLP